MHALRRSEIINLKAGADVTREDGSVLRVAELCAPLKPAINYTYSGDTRPTESVTKAARNADVLYREATFLQELASTAKSTGHSTAHQAAKLGREAGVRLLILGHLSSRYRDEKQGVGRSKGRPPKCVPGR